MTDYDKMAGYESPIQRIVKDITMSIEQTETDCLMKSVHEAGFAIDKEELERALRYDRNEYMRGVDYGLRLGREQMAEEFVGLMIRVCNEYRVDFENIVNQVRGE